MVTPFRDFRPPASSSYYKAFLAGVGPANESILNSNGITSTFQLLGKFLSFKAFQLKLMNL